MHTHLRLQGTTPRELHISDSNQNVGRGPTCCGSAVNAICSSAVQVCWCRLLLRQHFRQSGRLLLLLLWLQLLWLVCLLLASPSASAARLLSPGPTLLAPGLQVLHPGSRCLPGFAHKPLVAHGLPVLLAASRNLGLPAPARLLRGVCLCGGPLQLLDPRRVEPRSGRAGGCGSVLSGDLPLRGLGSLGRCSCGGQGELQGGLVLAKGRQRQEAMPAELAPGLEGAGTAGLCTGCWVSSRCFVADAVSRTARLAQRWAMVAAGSACRLLRTRR